MKLEEINSIFIPGNYQYLKSFYKKYYKKRAESLPNTNKKEFFPYLLYQLQLEEGGLKFSRYLLSKKAVQLYSLHTNKSYKFKNNNDFNYIIDSLVAYYSCHHNELVKILNSFNEGHNIEPRPVSRPTKRVHYKDNIDLNTFLPCAFSAANIKNNIEGGSYNTTYCQTLPTTHKLYPYLKEILNLIFTYEPKNKHLSYLNNVLHIDCNGDDISHFRNYILSYYSNHKEELCNIMDCTDIKELQNLSIDNAIKKGLIDKSIKEEFNHNSEDLFVTFEICDMTLTVSKYKLEEIKRDIQSDIYGDFFTFVKNTISNKQLYNDLLNSYVFKLFLDKVYNFNFNNIQELFKNTKYFEIVKEMFKD